MVFNPTSPIRALARRQVVITRTPSPHRRAVPGGKSLAMAPGEITRAASPLSGWRGGITRLVRHGDDRQPAQEEISRWSRTTTESEASALPAQRSSKRKPKTLKKTKQRRSKDTTNSSPVDPFYNPITKTLQPPGELPPVPTAGPDEPRSFLDSASDDSSQDESTSPVIQRASSVRVAKPHIVQHSNSSNGSVPKLYPHQTTSADEGLAPPGTPSLAPQFKHPFESSPLADTRDKDQLLGGPADALRALEGEELEKSTMTKLSKVPGGNTALENTAGPRDTMKETVLDWPDTPSRIEALSTLPTPMGGFGSLRMPKSDTAHSSSTYVSPSSIDGLRSNPTTEMDKKLSRAISAPVRNSNRRVTIRPADLVINKTSNDHKLYRESIVSTPYPARQSSISEMEEFREEPKLRRARPLSHHTEKDEPEDEETVCPATSQELNEKVTSKEQEQAPEVPLSTKPLPSAPLVTSKSDRFPSPVGPEVLFLDLRLASHPGARVTVEIEITDKTTFDDEQLFTVIRDAYGRKLLGLGRRVLSARTISHATLASGSSVVGGATPYSPSRPYQWHGQHGSTSPEIDGGDFIRHIRQPRLGRRRKTWLLWLRNSQYHETSPSSLSPMRALARRSRLPPTVAATLTSPQIAAAAATPSSPVFSFAHSRRSSHGNVVTSAGAEPSSSPTTGAATTGIGPPGANATATAPPMRSPTTSIPRMPFQTFQRTKSLVAAHSHSHSHLHSPRNSHYHHSHHHHNAMGQTSVPHPTLDLHHTFSLPKILTTLLLTFFLATFTSIMWILFGLPGRGADQGNGVTTVMGQEYPLSWGRDAQGRVGVGLVLGIVVLLLGLITEAVWVWGSWVLI